MRIASSTLELTATHVYERATTRQASLELWVGTPQPAPTAAAAAPRPAVPELPGTVPADATAAGEELERDRPRGTPREELDLAIILKTFRVGRSLTRAAHDIRKAYAEGARQGAASQGALRAAAARDGAAAPAPRAEGWGLRYDRVETTVEHEATQFAARGTVTTADGRTIDLAAALSMERTFAQSSEVHLRAGDAARAVDPLELNLAGGPAAFAGTTAFDLDGDGAEERVAALAPGSSYLAMDRDGSGTIDSGAELFGPTTGSGFGELAALDQDGNGWVDEGDAAFDDLRLWNPTTAALSTLAQARVGALATAAVATPFQVKDGAGAAVAQVAETGVYLTEGGAAGTIQHVDLVA